MVRIKNCGLTTPESIHKAAQTGAAFVGFVHYPASPRHVSLENVKTLSAITPNTTKKVIVVVDPSDATLQAIHQHQLRVDYLQVHGVDSVARLQEIATLSRTPIITGVSIRTAADVTKALAYESLSAHLLLDGKISGSGEAFDWPLVTAVPFKKPWFLAGGLRAENVADAVRITRAPMVDVSSGIESTPGVKSLEKIGAFNAAVLAISAHGN